ncbi:uncharacterized protein [Hetaerina americana]|uniref:uncharacterized protein isoform X1 n=1 Tax=Hetaerina americana TaxID=62018 RepID=UPI003A7F1DAA
MKEKSGIKSKRKKVPKVKEIKTANEEDDNVVMSCSRSKLMAALKLLEEKMQADKEKMQTQKIQKCKSIPGRIPGGARSTKFMPCSATYKSVQLRNALISHNWKDASLLLLNMLKDRKDQLLYRNMWKAFFIILQYSPHADHTRMEHFRQLCQQISGKDNFLKAVYLP